MKSLFDKLDLRPGERRLVVIVGIVVFVVLNLWFIIPNFGKYQQVNKKISETEANLRRFKMEVNRRPTYQKELKNLENQGVFVGQEDQALQLQREVESQSQLAGVTILRYDPTPRTSVKTNAFFDEQALVVTFSAGEKELIEFLYNLGSRNSLIRVRSMNLGREPTGYKLQGSLTLVESFQKKPKTTPVATTTPAARPGTTPAPKPAASKPPEKKPPVTQPPNIRTNQPKKIGTTK
jgi:hypothetical protein